MSDRSGIHAAHQGRATVVDTQRSTELVGRVQELRELGAVLQLEDTRAAIVLGEPGIGKTCLVRAALEGRDAVVAWALPTQADQDVPYLVISDLLEGLLPRVPDLAVLPRVHRAALEALAESSTFDGGGEESWRLVSAGLRGVLGAIDGPVILALDDLQWADAVSVRVLVHVMRRAADRVRVVATERVGFGLSLQSAGRLDDLAPALVRLRPMPSDALLELVSRRHPGTARGRVRDLVARSAGNPFVALSRVAVDGEVRPGAEPDVVRRLTRERLTQLGEREREVLRWISVLGRPTQQEVLAHVPGATAPLASVQSAGLVEQRGAALTFTHPLLRDAALADLSPVRLSRMHRLAAAGALDPDARARHLARATPGPSASVARLLEEAAARASGSGAPEAAAELLEDALRLTPSEDRAASEARALMRAEALRASGRLEDAAAVAEELGRHSPHADVRGRAVLVAARVALDRVSAVAAASLLREALTLDLSPSVRTAVLEDLLLRLNEVGEVEATDATLAELERVASTPLERVRASSRRILYDFQFGRLGALEGLTRLGDLDQEDPLVQDATTNIALWAGQIERVEASWAEILADQRARGDVETEAEVLLGMADFDVRRGRLAQARATLSELTTGEDRGRDLVATEIKARLLLAEGQLESARELGRRVIADAGTAPWVRARAHAVLGLADLQEDRPDAAAVHFDEAATTDPGLMTWRHGVCFVGVDRVEALARAGRTEDARTSLKVLAGQASRWRDPWIRAAVLVLTGHVLLAEGDLEAARDAASEAVAAHLEQPWLLDHGRALVQLGLIERRLGRRRVAREILAAARELLAAAGAHGWVSVADRETARIGGRVADPRALTPAQTAVARAVADGMSNREVAARLHLSVRTVETHLTQIYDKLGVRSRTAMAAAIRDTAGDAER